MTRRAARVDANQPAIVKALRKVGATVQHLHKVGEGCPDIAVGYRGANYFIEIKDGERPPSERKLKAAQVEWHQSWRGQVAVAHDADEALAAIGAVVVQIGASTELYNLPGETAAPKKNEPVSVCGAAGSRPKPIRAGRKSAMPKDTAPQGDWQDVGGIAARLVEEAAKKRKAQSDD